MFQYYTLKNIIDINTLFNIHNVITLHILIIHFIVHYYFITQANFNIFMRLEFSL